MNNGFSNLINNLVKIAPRRGKGEQVACRVLMNALKDFNIQFSLESFYTQIPITTHAELFADDKEIECLGASFLSGEFDNNSPILSSYGAKLNKPSIMFNPVSKGICMQGYQEFPAVFINRDSVVDLVMANVVRGKLEVSEEEFESANILVGNIKDPKRIIFAHYDSIVGSGAIDNAGSVAVLFQAIQEKLDVLKNNLFVFAGSEEESISRPDGCYGFEIFDREYRKIVDGAIELIVLDGVGVGSSRYTDNHVDWVFYVNRINKLSNKIQWLQNDQTKVMSYYHTSLDTLDKLNAKYLEEAKDLLLAKLIR